jgi:NADP-dependent 3-hydroxy acid dehydrogenase YdfG
MKIASYNIDNATTRFGRLDLLVNNAGVEQVCP